MSDLAAARRRYAEEIAKLAELDSPALRAAFARVPREAFLGPGPWQLLEAASFGAGYRTTPDTDPVHLYANVLVAIDPERQLNNGEPASLARWLQRLGLEPGERFAHVGAGVGYYTAIAAEVVGPTGAVVAFEADPALAARARANLAAWPQVRVIASAAHALPDASTDAIFLNAGATHVPRALLEPLRPGGRLIVPITVSVPRASMGVGHMLWIERRARGFAAQFVSPVGIYHGEGLRDPERETALRAAFERGDPGRVRSLRLAPHRADASCFLHADDICISTRAPEDD